MLTFQCIIECWGARLGIGMSGTILSCNVVATCEFMVNSNCIIIALQCVTGYKYIKCELQCVGCYTDSLLATCAR